jgi:hypothetical protein
VVSAAVSRGSPTTRAGCGSNVTRTTGRPRLAREVMPLLVQMADWISADLGHRTSPTRRSVVLEGRDGFF